MPAAQPLRDPLFDLYFYEEDLPISTLRVARSVLNRWADHLSTKGKAIDAVTKMDVLSYLKGLEDRVSKVTSLSHLVQLRRFYRWAVAGEYMDIDPTKGIRKRTPRDANAPHLPVMSEQMAATMVRSCGKNHYGRRDAAILSLLFHTGLRRSELCGLDIGSFKDDPHKPFIIVGSADHLTKSGKSRLAPVHPEAAKLLRLYLFRFRKGAEQGEPLFLSRSSNDGRMRPNSISDVEKRAKQRAGISERTGIHSFRRGWATDAVRSGMNPESIRKIAGWRDHAQLARYIEANAAELALDEYFDKMAKQPKQARTRLRRVV